MAAPCGAGMAWRMCSSSAAPNLAQPLLPQSHAKLALSQVGHPCIGTAKSAAQALLAGSWYCKGLSRGSAPDCLMKVSFLGLQAQELQRKLLVFKLAPWPHHISQEIGIHAFSDALMQDS